MTPPATTSSSRPSTPTSPSKALAERATAAGVQTSYINVDDERVETSSEALIGVLDALDADSYAPLPLEPVVVAWDGKLRTVARSGVARSAAPFRIDTEGGDTVEGEAIGHNDTWDIRVDLPLGYHRLHIGDDSCLVLAAPTKAHPVGEPLWGAFAPVYALRRENDRGIGDMGHLRDLISWTARKGGGLVATLPLLPMFLEADREANEAPSPYSPASVLFWNELFLDPSSFPFDGALSFAGGPSRTIDYDTIATQTRSLVDHLLADQRIDAWAASQPRVVDYALFRAYGEQHGQQWRSWPSRIRNGNLTDADVDASRARWHLAAQWAIDLQLRATAKTSRDQNVLLGLDYPVGVHLDGYDIWANQEAFVDGVTVGAPPDTFFAGGQDWQLVPIHPEASRRTGHRYLIEALRHQIALGGLLRIDHIMGLFRRWWIPAGGGPTQGAYVGYPSDELLAIICLESTRAGSIIVGENLGTVPPGVNEALDEHGILGMFIGQDHLNTRGELTAAPTAQTMSMVNTHDMAPFAEAWANQDSTVAPAAALDRVVNQLIDGPSQIVVVGLEDLWLEEERQNVPGSTTGNWMQRIAPTLDTIDDHAVAGRFMSENASS